MVLESRSSAVRLLGVTMLVAGVGLSVPDHAEDIAPHWSEATGRVRVHQEPRSDAARIGLLAEGEVFAWSHTVDGSDCESSTWAALVGGGFACLTDTVPSAEFPVSLPRRVRFDPPRPDEWETYLETEAWPRDPDTEEALLPYVYGKRWRGWSGETYASIGAWSDGAGPTGQLPRGGGRRSHFVQAIETDRGAVLVRPDGLVVPVDELHVYPVDRFAGHVVVRTDFAEDWLPGWIVAYEGVELRTPLGEPSGVRLPYHELIEVRPAEGTEWQVRDGLGPGQHGLLDDRRDMHHWVPRPAPASIEDAAAIWIDIDVGQQVLALRRGEAVEFVTLISGGRGSRTPTGLYAVSDKAIHDDMRSRSGATDPYYVEEVPWIIHFRPRYAIHGAYWHWGFGHKASHGCVNLAPADAQRVFDAVSPTLPQGWHTVWARDGAPGTLVRIRDGQRPVTDRRP